MRRDEGKDDDRVLDKFGFKYMKKRAEKTKADRKCLSCLKMFESAHIGNRLCEKCIRLNGSLGVDTEFSVGK